MDQNVITKRHMLNKKNKDIFSDFVGSFSDCAVLFPLLILLGQKTSFQLPLLFLSAGLMVIFSGIYYRVPMSVQPLKSIAIAAIAVGATAAEIQISTFFLSIVFFILIYLKTEKWLQYFSESWIHALQVALGVLLILQGFNSVTYVHGDILLLVFLSAVLIYLIKKWDWPILGVLATLALAYSFITGVRWSEVELQSIEFKIGFSEGHLRWPLIANLLLPQLVLTMANSVIATENTCKHYFSKSTDNRVIETVTKIRLMKTIAVSNFFSSLLGGLPMCHGSGGVTALYKGGARDWTSNLYLGCFLLFLTAVTFFYDVRFLEFPQLIFSVLLIVVGIYHLLLAKSTWQSIEGKFRLLLAVFAVFLTRNLIVVLAIQLALSFFKMSYFRFYKKSNSQQEVL